MPVGKAMGVEVVKPRSVVFSAFGLREGFYYSRLSEA